MAYSALTWPAFTAEAPRLLASYNVDYIVIGPAERTDFQANTVAIRARFGANEKVEEADLHVLAGKMAKVIRGRSQGLADLADAVRAGRIRTDAALREAADNLRRAPARPKE